MQISKLTFFEKLLLFISIQLLLACIFTFLDNNNNNNNLNFAQIPNPYTIKINYINTNIKFLDSHVKEYILKKKNEFLKIIKENKISNDLIYDFLVETEVQENENIVSTHIVVYSFTGGAHYNREDKTFIYNQKEQKFLNITDFLNSKNNFSNLTLLVRDILNKYIEKEQIQTDEEWLNEGTAANLENYQHFYLNANGMFIMFPPYQIASWADGEIKITIPAKDIAPLLKEKYQKELKIENTEMPSLKIEKELIICI